MLYQALKDQNDIEHNVFSLLMDGKNGALEFGTFESALVRSPSQLVFVPLADRSSSWNVKVDGFRIGLAIFNTRLFQDKDEPRTTGYTLSYTSLARLESGSPHISLPPNLYEVIMRRLLRDKRHSVENGNLYWGPCNATSYESLYLLIGETYFEIPPSTYVTSLEKDGKCLLAFRESEDRRWHLGAPFLRNFYSVWDDKNGQVGLGPHLTSPITRVHTTRISDLPRPTNTITLRDFLRSNLRRIAIVAF